MSDGWTIQEAAELLDPPMTADEVRALIIAARIQPIGRRRRAPGSAGGRPPHIYDPEMLLKAHAAIAPLLARPAVLCETRV